MAGYLDSASLVDTIKRKAMIPENQSTFQTADFLAFATEEMHTSIVPHVMSMHEEYFVFVETVALVASKSRYAIPYRAMGNKLRDVFYQDTQGNLIEMTRISPDDKSLFQDTTVGNQFVFYYLEGGNIVITPAVGSSVSGSLIMTYFMRPSDLVESSRIGVITAISTGVSTTTYTVNAVPTGFSTTSKLDLLQAKPGHKIRKIDIYPTSVNTTNKTITFNTSDIDSDTEIGDHIAFAGECMIPQIPSDLHPMLAQRVAARCLEALGDTQGLTNANAKIQEMEQKSAFIIDNRVQGSNQKVVNRRGLLQSSRIRKRRGWL